MDWAFDFYTKQYEWAGWPEEWAATGLEDTIAAVKPRVEAVNRLAGRAPKRILELGAGSGSTSAALAAAGHDVVAVELVDACVKSIRRLADEVEGGSLQVVAGDFFTADLEGSFDIVCYFDGFGVGSDDDQGRLLRRIRGWLSPGGCALIDVFAPWYWARVAGTTEEFPMGSGIYYEEGFEAESCRMLERMWRDGEERNALTQSLRCYSPADLRLLLMNIGLALTSIEPYGDETYARAVPLLDAMLYLGKFEHSS
jgi:SAM-dependent methyltransferase